MNGYVKVCATLMMLAMFTIVTPALGVEAVEATSTAEASVSVTNGDHVSISAEAETKTNNGQMSVESTVSGKSRGDLKASVSSGFSPDERVAIAQYENGYNAHYVVWSEADIGTPKSKETRKLDIKSESEAVIHDNTNADVDTNSHAVRDATGHISTSAKINTDLYNADTLVEAEIDVSGRQVETHVDADISSDNIVKAGIDADIDGKGKLHTDVDKSSDKKKADVDGRAEVKKGSTFFDLFVGTIFGSVIYG